jgi:hypothetical protein
VLTLGRLVVALIGLATVVIFLSGVVVIVKSRPPIHLTSSTDLALYLGLVVASIAGLAVLIGRWGQRESWIGAMLIGVGPALAAGLGLKAAVESALAGSLRPEDWLVLVATLAWGAAAAVCVAVAIALRRLPTPTSATAGPERSNRRERWPERPSGLC